MNNNGNGNGKNNEKAIEAARMFAAGKSLKEIQKALDLRDRDDARHQIMKGHKALSVLRFPGALR